MSSREFNARSCGFLDSVTCPTCWEEFAPADVLWISSHTDLTGDLRLGPEAPLRFLPSRFTLNGNARDGKGVECHSLACPSCHLPIAPELLEMKPVIFSIFGAPSSGKSFYLTSLSWELRRVLPLEFDITFSDSSPVANRILNKNEDSLFVNGNPDRVVPMRNLIDKTYTDGDGYVEIRRGRQSVRLQQPFLFKMRPHAGHPNASEADQRGRVICLYDNAGEYFLPGNESVDRPVTRHLGRSSALLFVLDPTQDNRFRRHCRNSNDGQNALEENVQLSRQELILHEAAERIRRFSGVRQGEKIDQPLIVVVGKYDTWSHLLDVDQSEEPWKKVATGRNGEQQELTAFDRDGIDARSKPIQDLLLQLCPEIVTAAINLAKRVVFIPVSSVGWSAHVDAESGQMSIAPSDAIPYWVTVPFLYAASRCVPGLIPVLKRTE